MTHNDVISLESETGVAVITINRPGRMNALNDAALHAMRDAMALARDALAPIVLCGAGEKAFSAGSDIKELAEQTNKERLAHTTLGQDIADELEHHRLPVIAAVEGYCLGGGLELALACDLRIASASGVFGLPEVAMNALPSWGGTYRLAPIVGAARARQMVLFGRQLDAQEALAWGLVAEVTAAGLARQRAIAIASQVSSRTSPETLGLAKSLLTHGASASHHVARQLEYLGDWIQTSSPDFDAGMSAFAGTRDED